MSGINTSGGRSAVRFEVSWNDDGLRITVPRATVRRIVRRVKPFLIWSLLAAPLVGPRLDRHARHHSEGRLLTPNGFEALPHL